MIFIYLRIYIHKSIHNEAIYPSLPLGSGNDRFSTDNWLGRVPSSAAGPGCPDKPKSALEFFPIVGACEIIVVLFFADKTTI